VTFFPYTFRILEYTEHVYEPVYSEYT